MMYEPKNWQNGEVITADALNHIENGIAGSGGVLIVNIAKVVSSLEDTYIELDVTGNELISALEHGKFPILKMTEESDLIEDGIQFLSFQGIIHANGEIDAKIYDFANGEESDFVSSGDDPLHMGTDPESGPGPV